MRYLLDTNVLSDARRRLSPELMEWLAVQNVDDLAISAVTMLELERGIQRKERRDRRTGAILRSWLEEDVRSMVDGRILPVDERVAITAAHFHVPDPMPEMDGLIAATALVHGLTLVTRNVRDMERTGVRILDPWER